MSCKRLFAIIALFGFVLTVNCQTSNSTVSPTTAVSNTTNVTTTEAPTTSTPVTTTLKPTTSPVTTATPNVTTTAAPEPPLPPAPEPWSGNVTENNNTCINAQFTVQINVSYTTSANKTLHTALIIPSDAKVDRLNSSCSNESQVIAITFAGNHSDGRLTIEFTKNNDEVVADKVTLQFIVTEQLFPQINSTEIGKSVTFEKVNLTLFKVAPQHSYVCSAPQSVDLEGKADIDSVHIDFAESKVQAFIPEDKKGVFDSEINCKSSEISDVVPIAVGAALAGLVVIVLIAYFIGRRRSRRLAYQSV